MNTRSWRFATSPSSGKLPFNLMDGECLLAKVSPLCTTGSSWTDEEVLALIAAAPLLLEACKALQSVAVHGEFFGHGQPYYHLIIAARAAIAKAEGQQ